MAKILVFAGSNSSTSINYEFVKYTAGVITNHDIQLLNMANYPFSMYSEDAEKKEGYSNSLIELKNEIHNADGLILAVNEYNGNPSAYFKNVLDWLSRLERNFLSNTKVLLMSTSPGKRGGIGALEVVNSMLPRFGAEIATTFSLPSFHDNFNPSKGIINTEMSDIYEKGLDSFLNTL